MILWLFGTLLAAAGLLSAGHAMLHKRDPRAALGWLLLCLGLPGFGAGFYWLLGVNRIQTRARNWQTRGDELFWQDSGITPTADPVVSPHPAYHSLQRLTNTVTRRPLLPGNRLQILHNGEEAYPAMLAAIAEATRSVFLCTYIFDSDQTGQRFAAALQEAAKRGLDVRVLVDALGERYSFPPARRLLKGGAVKVARFLPPLAGGGLHLNLRNHRKLLVIDSQIGFTGGMNIGDRHLAALETPGRVVDIHFRIDGLVALQMQQAFLEDWHFVTRRVEPPPPVPLSPLTGNAWCRGISIGPNEDYDKLSWILIGALNCARRRVRIMTPYFIPDRPLISAINAASLRGVAVEIVLPAKNNLPYLAWATRAYLWEFLRYGTRIFLQPPPFVHSKLLLVDDEYVLLGSANLDPRSFRLNFEFNLEVYDRPTAQALAAHFDAVRARSHETSLTEMDARPLPIKLRDAFAKLFSPYL